MASNTEKKHENLFFALRVLVAVVLFVGLGVGIYLVAYRGYPAVAEWKTAGSHAAFVYEGDTYVYVGEWGKTGLLKKDYVIDKSVGRVKDDGTPTETEAVTLPPDAEPGETVEPILPDGDPDLSRDHAYILYSIKNQKNVLLMCEPDGSYSVYFREIGEWSAEGDRRAFVYKGHTYELIGIIGRNGLSAKKYVTFKKLGVVRNDGAEDAEHVYMINTVKVYDHLFIVEGVDGHDYLYCRANAENPPVTTPEIPPESLPPIGGIS